MSAFMVPIGFKGRGRVIKGAYKAPPISGEEATISVDGQMLQTMKNEQQGLQYNGIIEYMTSTKEGFWLTMQRDYNLVLSDEKKSEVYWSSKSGGHRLISWTGIFPSLKWCCKGFQEY